MYYAGKTTINQFPGRSTSSSASATTSSTATFWNAPSSGSQTNYLKVVGAQSIAENATGIGIEFRECNGDGLSATSTPTDIIDNVGATISVDRYTYPAQRDTGYLTFVSDVGYENGATKIYVIKTCWLHIEGTICFKRITGVGTRSLGCGILRSNGTAYYVPMLGGSAQTVEPAADGTAIRINVTHYFAAGTIIKPCVIANWATEVLHNNDGSSAGLMNNTTQLYITRISDA